MPTPLNWSNQIDIYAAVNTATATKLVLPNRDGLTSTVFNGTGFTYDLVTGLPTGGTLTSMQLVVNSDQTVLQTVTGFTTTFAQIGTFVGQVQALHDQLPWVNLSGEPIIFTSTQIRAPNQDGTFTDVIGTGFSQAGQTFTGTVTEIKQLASDGTTVLNDLTGLNVSLSIGVAASSPESAGEQTYLLAFQGANTFTGLESRVTNTDFIYPNMDSSDGNDVFIGQAAGGPNPFPVRGLIYGAASSAVQVNTATGTATGGSGNDSFSEIGAVVGSNFNDTLTGSGNTDSFYGGNGDDVINGAGGDDLIDGGLGNDTLDGGAGTSDWARYTVDLSSGVTVSLNTAAAQITGGAGTDTLSNFENLEGSNFGDTLTGNSSGNILMGGNGSDFLTGLGGNDTIDGGAAIDLASYSGAVGGAITVTMSTTSTVVGPADVGTDTLSNVERVRGTSFIDTFTATSSFSAGGGAFNEFEGMGNNDIIYGNGSTRVAYIQALAGVTVNLVAGAGQSTAGGDAAGVGVDSFAGTFGPNSINAVNSVTGSAFADILTAAGGRGFFQFLGLGGNDTFTGSTEAINNFDWNQARYDIGPVNGIAAVLDTVSTVTDLGGSSVGTDTLVNVERVRGTAFHDTFVATAGFNGPYGSQNRFEGGGGDDTITGNGRTQLAYTSASAAVTVSLLTGMGQSTAAGDAAGVGVDTITGGVVTLIGSAFNDTLTGSNGVGAETFFGDAGNDTINGGGGSLDRVSFLGAPAGVTVNLTTNSASDGQGGSDILSNIEGAVGTEFNDSLTGDGNVNRLQGQNGDDQLFGLGGDDFLVGDDGVDLYAGAFIGGTPFDSGNDTLDGGTGADTMYGGKGNDTYIADNGFDVITENSGEGTDTVQASVTYVLPANVENLVMTGAGGNAGYGNALANTITGTSGGDVIDGMTGADTMVGGDGNDVFYVDNNFDVITETPGQGTDTVYSTQSFQLGGNVEFLFLQGVANINGFGDAVTNYIEGNSGDNGLNGGAGTDALVGRAGNDLYFVDNAGDVVTEAASEGNDTVFSTVTYTLSAEVESLVLQGSANINGTGNGGANLVQGNTGNNVLDGGAGADTMIGGTGNDNYVVDSGFDAITENSGEGNDTVFTAVTYVLPTNVENLVMQGAGGTAGYGNTLANVITGTAGVDTIDGLTGADTMFGYAGNDIFTVDNNFDVINEQPGEGTDTVYATVSFQLGGNVEFLFLQGAGNINGFGDSATNYIQGNSGDNGINGGGGTDALYGMGGNDLFIFAAGQANGDILYDFAGNGAGIGDQIQFTGFGTAGGGATFTQVGVTNQWQIHSGLDAHNEVITFDNAATIDPNDFFFT